MRSRLRVLYTETVQSSDYPTGGGGGEGFGFNTSRRKSPWPQRCSASLLNASLYAYMPKGKPFASPTPLPCPRPGGGTQARRRHPTAAPRRASPPRLRPGPGCSPWGCGRAPGSRSGRPRVPRPGSGRPRRLGAGGRGRPERRRRRPGRALPASLVRPVGRGAGEAGGGIRAGGVAPGARRREACQRAGARPGRRSVPAARGSGKAREERPLGPAGRALPLPPAGPPLLQGARFAGSRQQE